MKRLYLALILLVLATWPAHAQTPVSVIGPVTAGDCVQFNSNTIVKDAGIVCGGSGGFVVGPGSSVVNDLAIWGNTGGTLLADATGISAVPNGLVSIIGPSSALISTANSPNELLIQSGSTGTPITAGDTPTIQISRIESIVDGTSSGDGSLGAALRIDASTNNTQQLNGMKVAVYNLAGSTNDNVAIYGAAVQGGTLNLGIHAYGGYFVAEATTAGNYSVAVGTAVFNNQASVGYSSASCCGFTAFDAVAETTNGSATYMGAGIVIRGSTNAKWDVGLALQPSAIRTADIQSDSNATTMWLAPSGSHVGGIDWHNATFSSFAIYTPDFSVGPTGAIIGSNLSLGGASIGSYAIASPGFTLNTSGAMGASSLSLGGASIGSYAIASVGSIYTQGFVSGGLGFVSNSIPGVNCSGSPTSSFASSLGIVTHC